LDGDAALYAVIGPALYRLQMTFESRRAYREFWQRHSAFRDDWSPDIDAYVQYDLIGTPGELRSSCNPEAVRIDGREVLFEPQIASAIRELRCPSMLLWAERGMQGEPQGLYDDERLAAAELPSRVRTRRMDDVNHYTALLGRRGADAVAAAIIDVVGSVGGPPAVDRDGRSGHEGGRG
jgi:hypothetical protein